jgi:hypothetical protein
MSIVNVVVILDKSGSMWGRRDETIKSLNSYFHDLAKKEEADYHITLTAFDTSSERVFNDKPIREVELSSSNYHPEGWTALLDAVGETVSAIRDNGHKTLVIIYTDGEENSSKTWTQATVRSLVEGKRKAGYEFIFLGANEEAWKTGLSYGIRTSASVLPQFQQSTWSGLAGTTSAYTTMNVLKIDNNAGTYNVHNDDKT